MAISKKIRFEVFKRDGFACQYCGGTPPGSTLEVDHINPISKGGKDDINNLVTACFDCNRGKSNIPLNRIPSGLAVNLEILKEKEAQLKEYSKAIKKIQNRIKKDINEIDDFYSSVCSGYCLSDSFKSGSIKSFLKKLTKDQIIEAFSMAASTIGANRDDRSISLIKYACKICWNWIKNPEDA